MGKIVDVNGESFEDKEDIKPKLVPDLFDKDYMLNPTDMVENAIIHFNYVVNHAIMLPEKMGEKLSEANKTHIERDLGIKLAESREHFIFAAEQLRAFLWGALDAQKAVQKSEDKDEA